MSATAAIDQAEWMEIGNQVAAPVSQVPAPKRHSWIKVRIHVYICRKCGAGKVNAQDDRGSWFVTWHLPTGESRVASTTPECSIGPLTGKYVKKYESAIACADRPATDNA